MDWSYHEEKPDGLISNYIDCIWWENYSAKHPRNNTHYLVPDNTIELIFTNSTITRNWASPKRSARLKNQVGGLKTIPQRCTVVESPLLGVRFKPKGFYLFAQVPLKQTINNCLEPQDCFGKSIKCLEKQLYFSAGYRQRVTLIKTFFTDLLSEKNNKRDILFENIVDCIEASSGMIAIKDLSARFKVSTKSIERRFIRHIGITPKKYCRLVRVVNCLRQGPHGTLDNLTGLAHQFEYFDQSHFIKEVKAITHHTPGSFYKMDRGIQTPLFS